MHLSHSTLSAVALLLSLSTTEARVVDKKHGLVAKAAAAQEPAVPEAAFKNVFEKRQNNTNNACNSEDDVYEFLHTYSSSASVCSAIMGVQTVTEYDIITSTTVVTDTTATSVATRTVVQRTTATFTVTAGGFAKRGPEPTAAPEKREVAQAQMRNYVHQALANGTVTGMSLDARASSSFWSALSAGVTEACRCLNLPTAAHSTVTYTAPGVATSTVNVWIQTTETVMRTLTYSETVAPPSLGADPSIVASASASASAGVSVGGTVVGPAINCPASNNTYSQYEVDNRIYYYKVVCGVEFTDATLISLHSETAADCASACSVYNQGANARLCAGFDYYNDVAAGGYTCDLKSNMTVSHMTESVTAGALIAVYANGDAPPFAPIASQTTALAEISASVNTQVASSCSATSTQSATGTAFTTTFTDSAGYIHESWYSGTAFAASSVEICTYNYTQQYTTEVVITLPGTTITGAAVVSASLATGTEAAGATAFLSNGEIIIAHSSGTVIGSAIPGPATPFVTPIPTVSAGGSAVSTIYSTGTAGSAELNGTSVTSGIASLQTSGGEVNETVILSNGTVVVSVWSLVPGGSTLVTVVTEGATATAFSTGSDIILTPTSTGGETVAITPVVSASILVSANETVSVSETVLVSGGSTATSGEIVISPTTEVVPTTLSNLTVGTLTLSGATGGASSTGGEIVIGTTSGASTVGGETVIPTTISLSPSESIVTFINATSGASSTGGEIVLNATVGASVSAGVSAGVTVVPTTISLSPSESLVTFVNATSGAFSTGGETILTPTPSPSVNITSAVLSVISGIPANSTSESVITLVGGTTTLESTGGEIVLTPTSPFSNTNGLRTGAFSESSLPTPSSGFPIPSANVTLPGTGLTTPTVAFSDTNGLRTGAFSTASAIVVGPSAPGGPIINATVPFVGTAGVPTSSIPFSETNGLRTGAYSTSGSVVIPLPTLNSTLPGTGSLPSTPSFSNTNGLRTGEYSLSTPVPSSGLPLYTPPSPPSLNYTLPGTGTTPSSTSPFSNTNGLRTGEYSLPTPVPSSGLPVPSFNATVPFIGTAATPSSPFSNTNGLRTGEYSLSMPVPSSGLPVPNINATVPFIGTAGTPSSPFSNTNGLRTGEYSLSTPVPSSGFPVPSFNATVPFIGTAGTPSSPFSNTNGLRTGEYSLSTPVPSSGLPVPSFNATVPFIGTAGTPSSPFSNTNGLRTGEYSLSTPVPSSGLPVPSFNSSLPGTGTFSSPLTGVTPVPTLNSTLPGTGTPPGFSNTNGLRTGEYSLSTPLPSSGLPVPSLNSTLPGTGIVGAPSSGSTPTPSLNSTAPGFSNTNGLRTGQYSVPTPLASSGFPVPLANATAPSSGFPTPSANSSTPGFSNTNGLRTGQFSVPTPLASSGFPIPSLNATKAPSSGFPTPSANSSTPGFSNTNGLRTGGYSLPTSGPSSGFPVPSANASTCVTGPASTITVTSTSVSVSVSTLCATSCPASLLPAGVTASTIATSSAYVYLPPNIPAPSPPTNSGLAKRSLQSDSRRSAKVATQQQIDDACAETDNIIANADFESANADWSPEDWNVTDSTAGSILLASSNGARAVSAGRNANLQISQPLTLCPKSTYMLKAVASQPIASAGCIVSFAIGGEDVLTVQPSEKATTYSATYTAGSRASAVSVDLVIDFGSCSNADSMMLALEGVTLEPERLARLEQARKTLVKQAFGDWDLKKKNKE